MRIYIDTSSLFKLYHKETDSTTIENLFSTNNITSVFLSEITKIEFASTIWKKVRKEEITANEAIITLALFEADFEKYSFVAVDSFLVEQARKLVSKYGTNGLRTLDSIQLATAISLIQQVICL